MGKLQCTGVVLPGTEVCNCLDDDCNGQVDEGDLCSGGVCVDCHCSLPVPYRWSLPLARSDKSA